MSITITPSSSTLNLTIQMVLNGHRQAGGRAGTEKKTPGYTTCPVLNVSYETRKNVLLSCLSPSHSESNAVVIYLLLVLLDYEERKQQPTFPLEDLNSENLSVHSD